MRDWFSVHVSELHEGSVEQIRKSHKNINIKASGGPYRVYNHGEIQRLMVKG